MRPCVERLLGVLTPALKSPDWRVRWFDMYMDARYRGVARVIFYVGKTVMNLCVGVKEDHVVAEQLGHEHDTALTLGKAMAGLNAQSKGRMIGIYGKPKAPEDGGPPKKAGLGEEFWIAVCGRSIPVKDTEDGVRAVVKDKPVDPAKVAKYLESKFGDALDTVRDEMTALANSFESDQLTDAAYGLYEKFRPQIPPGKRSRIENQSCSAPDSWPLLVLLASLSPSSCGTTRSVSFKRLILHA